MSSSKSIRFGPHELALAVEVWELRTLAITGQRGQVPPYLTLAPLKAHASYHTSWVVRQQAPLPQFQPRALFIMGRKIAVNSSRQSRLLQATEWLVPPYAGGTGSWNTRGTLLR